VEATLRGVEVKVKLNEVTGRSEIRQNKLPALSVSLPLTDVLQLPVQGQKFHNCFT